MLLLFLLSLLAGGVTNISVGDRTPNLLYGDMCLLALVAISVLGSFYSPSARRGDKLILVLLCWFLIAQIFSLLINGSDFFRGMLSIKTALNGFAIYFVVLSLCQNDRDVDWGAYSLVAFATGMSVILIYKFVLGHGTGDELNKEFISIGLGSSNYLAAFSAFMIPVSLGLSISEKKLIARGFFAFCAVLMLFSLVITMSKGAALSLLVVHSIVLPVLLKWRPKGKYLLVLLIVGGAAAYVIPLLAPELLDKYVHSIQYRFYNPDYSRLSSSVAAWNDFLAHPWIGIGPYESGIQIVRYENMPHNFVLQTLAELGIIGGLPFLLIILVVVGRAYRNCFYSGENIKWRGENRYFFAGLVATLIHGLLELTFQGMQYISVFFVFAALTTLKLRAGSRSLALSAYASSNT